MIGKMILIGAGSLSLGAIPVAASAAPATAAPTASPASALSLSPAVRAGRTGKGEHISQTGWIVGVGMIALGAGALVLAIDGNNNNNDRPASR